MNCKLIGKILSLAAVIGLMMFTPLMAEAGDAKEKSGQSKMDAIEDSVEDSALTAKLKAKILATKELESLDIHVKTEEGVVTLSGKVESAEDIKLAEKVVREAKGVKGVKNNLSVK